MEIENQMINDVQLRHTEQSALVQTNIGAKHPIGTIGPLIHCELLDGING